MKCMLCNSDDIIQTKRGGGKCLTCNSISVKQLPIDQEIEEYYKEFDGHYSGGSEKNNFDRYARLYANNIKKFIIRGKHTDTGCSRSGLPNILSRSGFSVTVMDLSKSVHLDRSIKFLAGNIEKPLPTQLLHRYDSASVWAVLEHLKNPRTAIQSLIKLCKEDGGLKFISNPEIGTCLTNYSISTSRWFYPPEHLHFISPKSMENIFSKYNCELIYQARMELNILRWLIRYGTGLIEMFIGLPIKLIYPKKWHELRKTSHHKFCGIKIYVFRTCKKHEFENV